MSIVSSHGWWKQIGEEIYTTQKVASLNCNLVYHYGLYIMEFLVSNITYYELAKVLQTWFENAVIHLRYDGT